MEPLKLTGATLINGAGDPPLEGMSMLIRKWAD